MKCLSSFAVVLGLTTAVQAQPEPPVVLSVETEDVVLYRGDTFDLSKLRSNPNPTTSVNTAFLSSVFVGDIRTLNGNPTRGLWHAQITAMPFRANPLPGQVIADVDGTGIYHCVWHIYSPDGTYVGSLFDIGGGPSPYHVVVGGSGAFLGATGLHEEMEMLAPVRGASTSEDPSKRRIHGGGRVRIVFHLHPKFRPAVMSLGSGPAVIDSADFSPVTTNQPARAGEWLILSATGLGPTRLGIESWQAVPPYRQNDLHVLTSPVEVTVDGQPAEVRNPSGWPTLTRSISGFLMG